MTRKPPTKSVDPQFWRGRRDEGRAFSLAARQAMDLADPGSSANPIVSHIVLAAIAWFPSLTPREGSDLGAAVEIDRHGVADGRLALKSLIGYFCKSRP